MTRSLLIACLAVAALGAGCSSNRPASVPDEYTLTQIDQAVVRAEEELATGDFERALSRMRTAAATRGLPPEQRETVQRMLERAAERTIAETDRPGRLADLLDVELPGRLAVEAGVRGAELYFARGSRLKAFRLVQKVDRRYPHHHLRARAGALLADIGFSFADDKSRYMLFFSHRGHATEVLEYLVLNYPTEPRGDEAYARLADLYEHDRLWDLAIDKHQDLVLWYPDSPLATPSKARIPHLRLAASGSPEFDRASLGVAQDELVAWLDDFGGTELEREVRIDLTDCRQRLADSDLAIARFYRKVDNLAGAEWHARRAVGEASGGLDPEQLEEAQKLLDDILAKMERG